MNAPVVWLPKNRSFTGEDTYEIYIHGSIVIEKLIYKILSSYKNFRLAQPTSSLKGHYEWQYRFNTSRGNEIVNTQTEKQLTIAQAQLDGSLSKVVNEWREEIIFISSLVDLS